MPRLIFFPRVGPAEPETVVTGAALTVTPGSTLQPHSSKSLQTVGAAMVFLVESQQVAMWPDHRGNRAGEECMTTQMPSRCGRPLISILVLGTGSLLSLCPRHKSGELLGGGGSLLALDWRVPRSWRLIRRFTVYMGRSLLSSVMLDWIVGHCRDVGTMYAPGRPGGASSSRNEVACAVPAGMR